MGEMNDYWSLSICRDPTGAVGLEVCGWMGAEKLEVVASPARTSPLHSLGLDDAIVAQVRKLCPMKVVSLVLLTRIKHAGS